MAEYAARKRLAKLGFQSDIKELDSIKAEIFCIMDAEIHSLDEKKAKQHGKRK